MVSAAFPSLCSHRKERHILLYVVLPFKTARDAFASFLIVFGFHGVLFSPFFGFLCQKHEVEVCGGCEMALDNLWVRKFMELASVAI